ncbi:endo alpha-1,4 polygalactosaminidase [Deinococcus detaillensis]|nr:endo alpha-1,4 polygalactosaminidase [Deinococcus detaillensis]
MALPATLLGACGVASVPSSAAAQSSPAASNQSATILLKAEQGEFELESPTLGAAASVQPQIVVPVGGPGARQTITDPAASGGKAIRLAEAGDGLKFRIPESLTAGQYLVKLRARILGQTQTAVVLSLRSGSEELTRVTLTSSDYATLNVGTFELSPGDRLRLVRLSSASGSQASIDSLMIDIPPAALAPVPVQPAPQPVVVRPPIRPAPVQPAPVPTPPAAPSPQPAPQSSGIKLPPSGKLSWDWQIGAGSEANITVPTAVKLIDVDGFNTSAAKVAQLNAQGLYTVCYLDVGSYEPGRPDSAQYPAYLKVQQDPDWPAEYFLDVTDVFKPNSALAAILKKRFQMCKDKGFAAIEPDNLQNDENVKGGKITTQQQIDFNGWVADQAHAYGLAVFQKNGPDKILLKDRTGKMMVDKFDGILNEQCQEQGECSALAEYTKRGKLALNAEYKAGLTLDCALSDRLKINSIKRDLDLRGAGMAGYSKQSCP